MPLGNPKTATIEQPKKASGLNMGDGAVKNLKVVTSRSYHALQTKPVSENRFLFTES